MKGLRRYKASQESNIPWVSSMPFSSSYIFSQGFALVRIVAFLAQPHHPGNFVSPGGP